LEEMGVNQNESNIVDGDFIENDIRLSEGVREAI